MPFKRRVYWCVVFITEAEGVGKVGVLRLRQLRSDVVEFAKVATKVATKFCYAMAYELRHQRHAGPLPYDRPESGQSDWTNATCNQSCMRE